MPKRQAALRIDTRPATNAGGVVTSSTPNVAPPALPSIDAPDAPSLTTALSRSAATPTAVIVATWDQPPGAEPQRYAIQWSTSSGFPADNRTAALNTGDNQTGATIPDLATNALYYVRVAAIYRGIQSDWSEAASITTAQDTTPPAVVTSVSVTFLTVAGNGNGDLLVTWTPPTSANLKDVEVRIYASNGGTLLRTEYSTTGAFRYLASQNLTDTGGVGDASLYLSIRARSYHNVYSTEVTASPTKSAPAAPSSVTLTTFLSTLNVSVAGATDAVAYRYRIIQTSPSAADLTYDSPARIEVRPISVNATYQVGVRAIDGLGQTSSETLSSAISTDALTLADLRAGLRYSDSDSTTSATLKTAMSDDVRTSGGISYASNAGWVRWIRAERDLLDRYRDITISMLPSSGTTNWYIRTSSDGVTWSYYSGPIVGARTLTSVANAAAAQSAAISAGTLGGHTTNRVRLPTLVEVRFVELWLRNTAASTRVDEFMPRRLVQADDIEVEQLSALAADLGTITAGTVTGATIQTATSGARIELTSANGLRSYNSGGTQQVQIRTSDGALTWAGGNGTLNASGMTLLADSAYADTRAVTFRNVDDAFTQGELYSIYQSVGKTYRTYLNGLDATSLRAAKTSYEAVVTVAAQGAAPWGPSLSQSILRVDLSGNTVLEARADGNIIAEGRLNVGTASGATTGTISATVSNAGTTDRPAVLTLGHESSGTPAAGFGSEIQFNAESSTTSNRAQATISARWATATDASRAATLTFLVYDTTFRVPLTLGASGSAPTIGFYGTTPGAQPTITGSRGGNAALASLLTALAGLGLIVNSTT